MDIALGIVAGILGFLPVILSMTLARRSTSIDALTTGLYGLAGTCVSLVILVAALIACAMIARSELIAFVVAEVVVFLALTIGYVVYKNVLAKRRRVK